MKIKLKKARVVTIDRSRWLNGRLRRMYEKADYDLDSALFDGSTGTMCCLGFYSAACGVPAAKMLDKTAPASLARKLAAQIPKLVCGDTWSDDTSEATDLMSANDAMTMGATRREQRIIKIFAKIGVKARFVGRYPTQGEVNKLAKKLADVA